MSKSFGTMNGLFKSIGFGTLIVTFNCFMAIVKNSSFSDHIDTDRIHEDARRLLRRVSIALYRHRDLPDATRNSDRNCWKFYNFSVCPKLLTFFRFPRFPSIVARDAVGSDFEANSRCQYGSGWKDMLRTSAMCSN